MLPETEQEIDEFIAEFERCSLPKERWTHGAHLLTGACYVHRFGEAAAIDRMRANVRRYNEAAGGKNTDISGYHETITIAWIKLLAGLLKKVAPMNRAEFAAMAVRRFEKDRAVFSNYYDFDLAASTEARRTWLPPTLAPFD